MNKIDNILAELYQSDPTLKQHEKMLKKVIVELMELKPDTQFDEQFRQELRRRLMSLAETKSSKQPLLSLNFMKRFQLVGAGVALFALLGVSAWYLNGIYNTSNSGLTNVFSGPKITRAEDNAFGSLANLQAAGRGGGGGGSTSMSADSGSEVSTPSAGMGGDAKMIAQPMYNVKYVYAGEELTLSQDKVDVLKRIKNDNTNLGGMANLVSLGLIDMDSFSNTQLQSFNFAEDKDYGYMVNVSLSEGTININENWNKWYALSQPCGTSERSSMFVPCEPRRIDISQVPDDQVLINAANAFLESHNIPRSIYGQPIVNQDWRTQYEASTDKMNYWIPDVMNVVYPLNIDGQAVYDENGNPTGLNVSVRYSPEVRVSSVWDLTSQNYQSSSYEAESDVKRIMGLVEKGGFRNYYYFEDAAAKTIEVELGTPEISMVKLWNYKDGMNEELLVPALIFPVTKQPAPNPNYWIRKTVVIPLVKEILDNENGGGPIRIMPADAGATEPAVLKAQ